MRLVFNKKDKYIFDAIRDGSKRVETRAATAKYKNILIGEKIVFSCDGKAFEKVVAKVTRFKSVDEMLKVYTPSDISTKDRTKEELKAKIYSFPGYEEKIKEFGIVAIEFK